MFAVPLQVIDNFLLQYNVGQAILALFILSTLGALPLKSMKIVGLNAVAFGLLFLLTPSSLEPVHFKFLGIALLFVGPLLIISARR
ncbi:hypothetical protein [Halorarius litoreus]|uniref:hypothetical protein n=1 Tax=Halorarius litoreus TaxID=2962676 RepID=UPI0020CC0F6B|nr:hypothetical protein [Halorarius litoreus]